jgi:vitamin B12 transporter
MMERAIFAVIGISMATMAHAQEDSLRTIEMKNVTIQENRFEIPFAEASRNISIIDSEDIKRLSARSVPEILSFIPGVDIRQRGPLGAQADISIRGGSFEQTLVLINGIKMSDPQTGHHSLSLPINIHNIERVEVLKGPGARIFGQNAFSGAVNFITKIPEEQAVFLSSHTGNFGLLGMAASVSLPHSAYRQYISVSRDVSKGYRYNTDFRISNLFYQSEMNALGGQFSILGGIVDRNFGANGYYASPDYKEQYEEVTTSLMSIGYSHQSEKLSIKPRIYWRRNQDDYLFFRDNPSVYRNNHFTNVWGAEVNSRYQSIFGETGFGLEFRSERIIGDWERGGEASKSNLHGFHRELAGLYVEHKLKLLDNRLHITPGVFVSGYSDFGINTFPGLDFGFSVVPELRIYGNLGKSYRIPTFYDQYYKSPVEIGNPDLDPETAISYEGGLRYYIQGISWEINYFNQRADRIIDWVMQDGIWYSRNFSDVNTAGAELSVNLNFNEIVGNISLIEYFSASYNRINSSIKKPEGVISKYALDNLQDQLIMGLRHKIVNGLSHNIKVRMVNRVAQSSYWLLDSKLNYDIKRLNIFSEITNLANVQYVEVMTPMPGRWFRIGANFKINL